VAPFHTLRPAPEVIAAGPAEPGAQALALASAQAAVVYLPAGGAVELAPRWAGSRAQWFDPRTGALIPAAAEEHAAPTRFVAPPGGDARPWDWALTLG
jgi:hypothetical protein